MCMCEGVSGGSYRLQLTRSPAAAIVCDNVS